MAHMKSSRKDSTYTVILCKANHNVCLLDSKNFRKFENPIENSYLPNFQPICNADVAGPGNTISTIF